MDIILVEDDVPVRHSLKMLLTLCGHNVRDFGCSIEALLHPLRDQCLIADYLLPDLDGLELIKRLRPLGWNGSGILITGYFDETLKVRAERVGYIGVYEKPACFPELVKQVAHIATRKAEAQALSAKSRRPGPS